MFVLPNCSGGIVPSRGRDAPCDATVSIVEGNRRTQLQVSTRSVHASWGRTPRLSAATQLRASRRQSFREKRKGRFAPLVGNEFQISQRRADSPKAVLRVPAASGSQTRGIFSPMSMTCKEWPSFDISVHALKYPLATLSASIAETKEQVSDFTQCKTELTRALNDGQAVKHGGVITSLSTLPFCRRKQANPLVVANRRGPKSNLPSDLRNG